MTKFDVDSACRRAFLTGAVPLIVWASVGCTVAPALSQASSRPSSASSSSSLRVANPQEVGFSPDSLQGVRDVVRRHIDAGDIGGVVTLIARNGRVFHWEAQGIADPETKRPMRRDDVFWMASMTKPLVAAAVLMLSEQRKLGLDDPVSKYIPEFKVPGKVKVAERGAPEPGAPGRPGEDPRTGIYIGGAAEGKTAVVPASRAITIKDLLTHTSGLLSIGPGSIDYLHPVGDTLATATARLGEVPLDFQPGAKWAYSNAAGFDSLARIVEVASGQRFDQFLESHLFGPLGLRDTSFGPPKDRGRAVTTRTNTSNQPSAGLQAMIDGTTYFSGAAGVRSTAADYWRFLEMLRNGGELDGRRVLKPESVAMMTSNHVGSLYEQSGNFSLAKRGVGFGFGVMVITDQKSAELPLPTGSFNWNGINSNWFWVMPKHKMVLILLCPPTGSRPLHEDVVKALGKAMQNAGLN